MKQGCNYRQKIIAQLINNPLLTHALTPTEVSPLRLNSVQNSIFKLVIVLFQFLLEWSLILDTQPDMLQVPRLCWCLVLAAVQMRS